MPLPIIRHRPTHTKKAAMRMLPYLEELLKQVINHEPKGMFLSAKNFYDISPHSLQVKFTDALLWLTRHNIDETNDRRKEFEMLKMVIKNKQEEGGLRICVMVGPPVASTVRGTKEVKEISTWKQDVEKFLADEDEIVKVFPNIIITADEFDWVKRVTTQVCGPTSSVTVTGDKLVICKS